MLPYMVYPLGPPDAADPVTTSGAPATTVDSPLATGPLASPCVRVQSMPASTTTGLVDTDFSASYDFDPIRFHEDLMAARAAFEEDNEGMSWEDFAAEYLDDLRALRESRAEGRPTRSYEEFRKELGL